jgi:predicted GH43/DUF377 family glycosyl hydrolase
MSPNVITVRRTGIVLKPDNKRVLLRDFSPAGEGRSSNIIAHVNSLSEKQVEAELNTVQKRFNGRHHKFSAFLLRRYEQVLSSLNTEQADAAEKLEGIEKVQKESKKSKKIVISKDRKLLTGAYFTQEYALEGSALFNPSLVWHPNQSGAPEGGRRFILSLRATGEGHISSITFRTGSVDAQNTIMMDKPTGFVTRPESVSYPAYDRALFENKLRELNHWDELVAAVLFVLPEHFTMAELEVSFEVVMRQNQERKRRASVPLRSLMTLAQANYTVTFTPDQPLCERVLFPASSSEINGMEDARFVAFQEEDGTTTYIATYTAYDGKMAMPQILKTTDFLHFEMSTLSGFEVRNKGMALFPRRINGRYAMLSRQDNENLFLMFSDSLHFWYTKALLVKPTYLWEYVQLGNCGSPIETEAGWLVFTHGVGSMRQYAIGAILLDINDPSKVIGRLHAPLLAPNEKERDGYVPNVVYSCGSQIHNGEVILPYAVSDYSSSIAIISLQEVLNAMEKIEL